MNVDQLPNPKLDLIPTNGLLDALLFRYDDAVFVGMIDRKSTGEDHRIISRRYVGDLVGCMGLLTLIQSNCAEQLHSNITDIGPGDL